MDELIKELDNIQNVKAGKWTILYNLSEATTWLKIARLACFTSKLPRFMEVHNE